MPRDRRILDPDGRAIDFTRENKKYKACNKVEHGTCRACAALRT